MFSFGFKGQLFFTCSQRSHQLHPSSRWELSPPRHRSSLESLNPPEVFLCWSTKSSGGPRARAAGHRASTTSSMVRLKLEWCCCLEEIETCLTLMFHWSNQVDLIGAVLCHLTGTINEVTITGLKPETSYQVQLSAINGKGEGESSAEKFKTEPVSK